MHPQYLVLPPSPEEPHRPRRVLVGSPEFERLRRECGVPPRHYQRRWHWSRVLEFLQALDSLILRVTQPLETGLEALVQTAKTWPASARRRAARRRR